MKPPRESRRRWEVVRLGANFAPAEVLGRYRWLWLAKIHHDWANIGIRRSIIRDAHNPGTYADPVNGQQRDATTGRYAR